MPTHEIFNEPLKVTIEYEDYPAPYEYYRHPPGTKPGEPLKVWRVQNKKFPDIDPGLVAWKPRFIGLSDGEVISGGINSKGPEGVALARHGNFFLWGFSAQPSEMTEEARKAFVNAVCYIRKFDGHKPGTVSAGRLDRNTILRSAYYLRSTSDVYIGALVKQFNERKEDYPEETLKKIGDPAKYYREMFNSSVKSHLQNFPEDMREQFGLDAEKYVRHYQDNLEYLFFDGRYWKVDEDVKSLGVSNRKVELLDRCVALLEAGEQLDLAQRILSRYTGKPFDSAEQWRMWFDENRDELVISDTGSPRFADRSSPAGRRAASRR